MIVTVVLAMHYRQFALWCREQQISTRDRNHIFVGGDSYYSQQLRGRDKIKVVTLEGARPHQDVLDILHYYRATGRIVEDTVD
jgi:hypothetical protein